MNASGLKCFCNLIKIARRCYSCLNYLDAGRFSCFLRPISHLKRTEGRVITYNFQCTRNTDALCNFGMLIPPFFHLFTGQLSYLHSKQNESPKTTADLQSISLFWLPRSNRKKINSPCCTKGLFNNLQREYTMWTNTQTKFVGIWTRAFKNTVSPNKF